MSRNQPIYLKMVFLHYPEEFFPLNISFFAYTVLFLNPNYNFTNKYIKSSATE